MNKITKPDEISYKEARKRIGQLAPLFLVMDIVLAAIIWFFRDSIFEQPEADFLGNMIAIFLIIAGVFTYFMLKAMEKRIVRSRPLNNEEDEDIKH